MPEVLLLNQEKNAPSHFSQIPWCILEILDPYEYKVYSYLKKIAGEEGHCYHSVAQLAAICKMSERKIRYSLRRLSKPFKELHNTPLIFLKFRKSDIDNNNLTNDITLVPIWKQNLEYNNHSKKLNNVVHKKETLLHGHEKEPKKRTQTLGHQTQGKYIFPSFYIDERYIDICVVPSNEGSFEDRPEIKKLIEALNLNPLDAKSLKNFSPDAITHATQQYNPNCKATLRPIAVIISMCKAYQSALQKKASEAAKPKPVSLQKQSNKDYAVDLVAKLQTKYPTINKFVLIEESRVLFKSVICLLRKSCYDIHLLDANFKNSLNKIIQEIIDEKFPSVA